MPVDLLETGDDAAPSALRRRGLAALLVVGVAAAVWLPSRLGSRTDAEDAPALRLSVHGFATRGSTTSVDYTVTNGGRQPVRLLGVAVEDEAARVTSLRVPDDDIDVGQSVLATVRLRFACGEAETRPLRPRLRLTAVTPDGQRHVVAPAAGSDLGLDEGGGTLLTGPLTAPCPACIAVLDALAPVSEETHRADREAAAAAAAQGARVVPSLVEQARQSLRAAQGELPADQQALATTALDALTDLRDDDATASDALTLLDEARDDLDELCDPGVPEVLR